MKKPFSLKTRDCSLMKSAAVRKWLAECEKRIKAQMESDGTAWWREEEA